MKFDKEGNVTSFGKCCNVNLIYFFEIQLDSVCINWSHGPWSYMFNFLLSVLFVTGRVLYFVKNLMNNANKKSNMTLVNPGLKLRHNTILPNIS